MNKIYTQKVGRSLIFSFLVLSAFLFGNITPVKAQCGPSVPTFNVNLTGQPAGTFISPAVARLDNCCGTSSPDRCIRFIITLDPQSVGVNFTIASGAVPPGAIFYQVSCGPQQPVGEFICLTGVGPHTLTFCKPGNNVNTYAVTSIPAPIFPADDTVRVGCTKVLTVLGLKPATTTFQSIFPGAPGQYNSYLSCTTGCTNPTYTLPLSGYPPFIDYEICGFPLADKCGLISQVCGVVRIYNRDSLRVIVNPNPASYCAVSPGVNLTANVTGGSPPYVYIWKNSGGTVVGGNQSYFANSTGTYTVEVRDGLVPPCPVKIISVPVTIANVLLSTSKTNVSCNGGTNGTATVTPTGGAAPYTYLWTGGQTTQTATGLAAGVYNVVVTDAGGCNVNTNVTITQPTVLNPSITSQGNVGCQGENTGSIDLSVSGGTGPYTYFWSNGETTQDLVNLSAGTYNVLVTDANGCTAGQGATISEPGTLFPLITSAVIGNTNISCNGDMDGNASISVTGGTMPFSYLWSTGATTQNVTGLGAGTVTVTVTDLNGCSANASSSLTQPAVLTSNVLSISTFFGGANVSCNGSSNGSVDFNVNGGTVPYTYAWSNGATTQDLSGLTAGTYTVTVTDANSCTTNNSVTLTQPAVLMPTVTGQNNAGCNGEATGSIDLTTVGGAAPYTFSWSNGATTEDISALLAGTYTVNITDINGCMASQMYTITEPAVLVPLITSATIGGTNIACNGGNNGTASVAVTGGTPAYIYNWSNGATTASLTGLTAGTISVIVSDQNGCSANDSFILTEPDALISAANIFDYNGFSVSCIGSSDGSIDLTVFDGTPPYTYLWSNGATTEDISGLAAGPYNVTITDANNCTLFEAYSLTEPTLLTGSLTPIVQPSGSNVSCIGGIDGDISLAVNGGVGPYTYLWSNGETTQDISGLAAGPYSVVITDDNGCTANANVTLSEPATATVVTSISSPVYAGGWNVSCNGGVDGAVNITVAGGSPPYTFYWSNGDTTQNISGVSVFTYTVIVTDANGCTATDSITLTEPALIVSVITPVVQASGTNISCNGGSDGVANLVVNGGTAPYTYLWSNGATTQNLTGVPEGLYSVTITDVNGCTELDFVTLTEPTLLTSSFTVSAYAGGNNVTCNAALDGSIDVTVNNGSSPYTYLWSNGATTQDLSGIGAGSYTVTITDVNGCTNVHNISLIEPALLAGSLSASNYNGSGVTCNAATDGSIDLTFAGGTPPYVFSWSNGATTEDLIGLGAGTYTVTVTDANGCSFLLSLTITEPPVLGNSVTPSVYAGGYNVTCAGNDGSINLTVTGGTTAYTYLWSNGATTEDLSGIAAGTYSVTVTDANGCTTTNSLTLTQASGLLASATATIYAGGYNITCNGATDGNIDLTVTGGVTPYTYLWSNGATMEDLTGLGAGTYTVTVTDAQGCVTTAGITLSEPALLAGSLSASNYNGSGVTCNAATDGSIDLTFSGGTPPYVFSWSNGATTEDLIGLGAGSYTVTVTDANGCSFLLSQTLTEPVVLANTAIPAVYAGGYNVTCAGNDGSINLTVTGGTTAYTYLWSNGATTEDLSGLAAGPYSVTVTDANGCITTASLTLTEPVVLSANLVAMTYAGGYNVTCNGALDGSIDLTVSGGVTPYTYLWSNGATTEDLAGLGAGTYDVTITDAQGCTVMESITLTEPAILAGSLSGSNFNGSGVTCNTANDGSIDLTFSGGTPPYTFLWSNGETTQNITGLTAGVYNVTVTDANGCSFFLSHTITEPIVLSGVLVPSVYAGGFNVTCAGNDGEIDLTVSGGTTPYTYSWSNGATTEDLTGLGAGSYTVTVTDANGCVIIETIILTSPGGLSASATATIYAGGFNITCNGASDGMIDLTVVAGVPPYTYLWSNGATTEDLSGLMAGTYSVTVTDDQGCNAFASITLTEPPVLGGTSTTSNYNGSGVTCNGACDGSIDFTPTGGTTPYTYLWSNGETTQDVIGICAGGYSVVVTDANGCSFVHNVTITEPPMLLASEIHTDALCNASCDGTIDVTVAGGTMPYTYLWSNAETTEDLTGLCAGSYDLIITDANGCTFNVNVIIGEPVVLSSSINPTMVSCYSFCNGQADLTVAGGTLPYTYLWSNGETTEDITGLCAGTYDVIVTDANGCILNDQIIITEPFELLGSSTTINASCFGDCDGEIDITVQGGTAPYSYSWSNGATTEDLTGLCAGTYDVIVTDVQNCVINMSIIITEPAILAAVVAQSGGVSCNGVCDAQATVSNVTGGTLPYTYLWSNGDTTATADSLCAGLYNVTITDANGCFLTLDIDIIQPVVLALTAIVDINAGCNGACDGQASVTATTGGTAPFTYLWSNGDTGITADSLCAGTYTVTVTDANGCIAVTSVVITEPAVLAATVTTTAVLCNAACNGTATMATTTGGTAPFTYQWSNGDTGLMADSLCVGSYTLSVTDANGCFVTVNFDITEPAALEAVLAIADPISCNGSCDGSIDLTVSGGTAPFTYLWSNGATTEDLTGLCVGNYMVTVTDANGCIKIVNMDITEPAPITFSGGAIPVSCNGANDGEIDISAAGGTAPYTFLWSNGETTEDLTGLAPGTYSVTVTDLNGCTYNQSFTITQPPAIIANAGSDQNVCGSSTSMNGNLPGGASGVWTVVSGSGSFNNANDPNTGVIGLANGPNVYQWTITLGGCTASDEVTVNSDEPVTAEVTAGLTICETTSTVFAVNPQIGFGSWSTPLGSTAVINNPGSSTSVVTNLSQGVNMFIWTVTNGQCFDTDTVFVTLDTPTNCEEDIEMPTAFSPNGDGNNDDFLIKGLQKYPDNTFLVFNRWGNEVYAKNKYYREWVGDNKSSDPLPDGTYYVILKVNNYKGGTKVFKGYVDMRR